MASCKVDRITDKYDLHHLDERLTYRYETRDEGVRKLARWLNQRILQRVMEKHGMTVLDGEAENYHRLLTDDDVMDSTRDKAKCELRDAGVDVDKVKKDFVSYRTVLKHLRECLDEDTSRDDTPTINKSRQRLAKVQGRITTVIEKTLDRLRKHDEIEIADPRVNIKATVRCGLCNRRHDVDVFLAEGGVCECKQNETTTAEGNSRSKTEEATHNP